MLCPDPPDLEPLQLTLRFSLLAAALLLAAQFAFPRTSARLSALIWRKFLSLARKPLLCASLLFFGVIALRVAQLHRLPVPVPGIHDEFSYLLMGDTFAHGRLSNPPHPMWVSFETFHVNWLPRYASMYPPGQGIVLAIGQLLGNPWIGVLLSAAAMASVIFWMLLAWSPRRWALLGGVIVWLKFCVAGYWINSYWGGAVAATAGALLLGALARLVRNAESRARNALLLALALAILANSRPYEGMLFSLPAAFYLLRWLFRAAPQNAATSPRWKTVLLPIIGVLALTAAGMAYYNHALTGHALLFPHTLNVRTYHSAPMFLFQASKPPLQYRNQQFEDFYNEWEREEYDHTWESIKCLSWLKTVRLFSAYGWWGMFLAAPGIYFVLGDRRWRLLWIMLALVTLGTFLTVWSNAHYAAPVTAIVVLFYLQSLRHLRLMRWKKWRWGAALARASVLLLLADTTTAVVRKQCDNFYWTCQGDISRLAVQHKLEALPGKHLVMVRYGEDHNIHDDWVFNGAEIDSAKVIWAREIGEEQDAKLFDYFHDRKVWLVTPDTDNTYLAPYTPPPDRDEPEK
ncbi:MAG TPA: hypothetical protein VLC94_05270 [Candidatus Acidoferrum sp.]|nr:hypothetical protein [Candidatus Acidoferrum sp.]